MSIFLPLIGIKIHAAFLNVNRKYVLKDLYAYFDPVIVLVGTFLKKLIIIIFWDFFLLGCLYHHSIVFNEEKVIII